MLRVLIFRTNYTGSAKNRLIGTQLRFPTLLKGRVRGDRTGIAGPVSV